MEVLSYLIIATAFIALAFGGLTFMCAWSVGGEFYISEYQGRRKNFLERLLDGFEILKNM
jgi:hypothetical protein